MPFVHRTSEEMLEAFDWWFLNHPYPDKPFYDAVTKGPTTPRNVYAALRKSPQLSLEFCNFMLLVARKAKKDPLDMIRNASYDAPWA